MILNQIALAVTIPKENCRLQGPTTQLQHSCRKGDTFWRYRIHPHSDSDHHQPTTHFYTHVFPKEKHERLRLKREIRAKHGKTWNHSLYVKLQPWIFQGHPSNSTKPTLLSCLFQMAQARHVASPSSPRFPAPILSSEQKLGAPRPLLAQWCPKFVLPWSFFLRSMRHKKFGLCRTARL